MKDLGHRRRRQEVLRRSEEAVVPEGRRLPEVPQDLWPVARTTSCSASASTCCRTRSATRSSRARTTSAPPQIPDFYNKNKARFAQPEKRDLQVVLTKDQKTATRRRMTSSRAASSWKTVAKKYSIDDTSKANSGKLPAQAKGTLDKQLDDAVFSADKGKLAGSDQDAVRLLRLHRDRHHAGEPADARPGQRRRSSRRSQSQDQQKALDAFVKDFTTRWKAKTECSPSYKTSDCKNGPKATPTPTATVAAGVSGQ